MRWTDLPSRKAAFSLSSLASQATTWASAPARSASTITLPGSGMNILRILGSLKSCAAPAVGVAASEPFERGSLGDLELLDGA